MHIGRDGWAVQDHAGESVPAAMYNGIEAARRRGLLQKTVAFKTAEQIEHDEWRERVLATIARNCEGSLFGHQIVDDRVCSRCGLTEVQIAYYGRLR